MSKRPRLSIDMPREEVLKLKAQAALKGYDSVSEYIRSLIAKDK